MVSSSNSLLSRGMGISSPLDTPEKAKQAVKATNNVANNTIVFLIIIVFLG